MKLKYIISLSVSVLVGLALIGGNFKAQLGIIDDHGIMTFLNGRDRLNVTQIIPDLKTTEFYSFGNYPRFRPVYFLFKVVETFFWGSNPFLWYFSKFVFFVFSFWLFWIVLNNYIDYLTSFLVILFTLTFNYWADIWTRLGPGEIYCVPGLAIFAWATTRILKSDWNSFRMWILFLVGVMIMIGSKETFAFILPLIILIDIYLTRQRKLTYIGCIFSALSIGFILFILAGVGTYVFKTGKDIYDNSVNLSSRVTSLIKYFNHAWTKLYPLDIIVLFLLIPIIFWFKYKFNRLNSKQKEVISGKIQLLILTFSIFGMVVLSQIYFYDGVWPVNTRYDFPGMLVIPFSFVSLYLFAKSLFRVAGPAYVYQRLQIWMISLLSVLIILIGYNPLLQSVKENVDKTSKFQNVISKLKNDISSSADIPIIFQSCYVWDYEPIESVNAYLINDLKGRSIYLKVMHSPDALTTDLEKYLSRTMTQWSINGEMGFKPLSQKPAESNCYYVNFSCKAPFICKKGISIE